MTIEVPPPVTQIGFAAALSAIRALFLQDALAATVREVAVPDIDRELESHAPAAGLSALAARGLRGELVFPVPVILRANPRLLGYYRLLYGFSQKEFYSSATGLGRFKGMEEHGRIRKEIAPEIESLARAMCVAGAVLVSGLEREQISAALLEDLALLTLGPQLRGGANVRKGVTGLRIVFDAIHGIVVGSLISATDTRMTIAGATGRTVLIEFAADPDIVIREEMRPGSFREIVAIEVKAGSDFSNIHNRIGEAEKSHQKARAAGFAECWTVVNVDRIDLAMARRESPSTNRFYRISDIAAAGGADYDDFRDRVLSLTGVPS